VVSEALQTLDRWPSAKLLVLGFREEMSLEEDCADDAALRFGRSNPVSIADLPR